jgi:hypothetical protein
LCDSFNTPEAIIHLRDLVSRTNVYINSQGKNLNIGLVENVARWVGEMLGIFGLGEGKKSEIGWGQEGTGEDSANVSLWSRFSFFSEEHSNPMYQAGRGPYALPASTIFFPGWCSTFGYG